MPLYESNRRSRDRWPLEFDLAGVPRETAERERLLKEHLNSESATPEEPIMPPKLVKNQFTVDAVPAETVVDLNNPPKQRYQHQEFPKMLYPPNYPESKAIRVDSKEQEAEMLKKKFTLKPPSPEPAGVAEVYGESDEQEARDEAAEDRAEDAAAAKETGHKKSKHAS